MKTLLLATALTVTASAGVLAQSTMSHNMSGGAPGAMASMPAPSPADYVKMAGAGDLYERQSSQLVLQTSKDAKIRQFAQMMVTQHAKSTADVKAAAARSKVMAPPPMLMPDQADMIAQLTAARGTDRDALYVSQQRTAHDKALALHQSFAANGSAAPLKMAAAKIVPVVQHHIEMLQAM